jgi:hypothetical protein
VKGPWFDNNLALLRDGPDGLRMTWHRGVVEDGDELHPRLEQVASITVPAMRQSTVSSSAADPSEASAWTSGE